MLADQAHQTSTQYISLQLEVGVGVGVGVGVEGSEGWSLQLGVGGGGGGGSLQLGVEVCGLAQWYYACHQLTNSPTCQTTTSPHLLGR